ncbi:MAG: hypothetical protein LUD44_08900 [Firmicutes bacterium]|nr:hypothetical protein [Bacillota bacterium]
MNTPDAEMYSEIYRSAGMGTESILALMPKVKNDMLKRDMTAQMNGYGDFRSRAEAGLASCGRIAEDEKKSKVAAAKTGIAAETMIDSSASHIAELMIRGSNADIVSITRAQNQASHGEVRISNETEAYKLCSELIAFENDSIERMRRYL